MFNIAIMSFSLRSRIESKLFKPFKTIRRCACFIELFKNISWMNHNSNKSYKLKSNNFIGWFSDLFGKFFNEMTFFVSSEFPNTIFIGFIRFIEFSDRIKVFFCPEDLGSSDKKLSRVLVYPRSNPFHTVFTSHSSRCEHKQFLKRFSHLFFNWFKPVFNSKFTRNFAD